MGQGFVDASVEKEFVERLVAEVKHMLKTDDVVSITMWDDKAQLLRNETTTHLDFGL